MWNFGWSRNYSILYCVLLSVEALVAWEGGPNSKQQTVHQFLKVLDSIPPRPHQIPDPRFSFQTFKLLRFFPEIFRQDSSYFFWGVSKSGGLKLGGHDVGQRTEHEAPFLYKYDEVSNPPPKYSSGVVVESILSLPVTIHLPNWKSLTHFENHFENSMTISRRLFSKLVDINGYRLNQASHQAGISSTAGDSYQ